MLCGEKEKTFCFSWTKVVYFFLTNKYLTIFF